MLTENITTFLTGNWFGIIFSLTISIITIYYISLKLSKQINLIGKKFKLSPGIRGATFDAIGGSLPELLIALIGLRLLGDKGLEIGIGAILGSAIFNILMIPFLAVLFYKKFRIKKISNHDITRDIIFLIIAIFILFIGLYLGQLLILGLTLIVFYLIYLYVLYFENKIYIHDHKKKVKRLYLKVEDKNIKVLNIVFYIFILYFSVELSVKSLMFIAGELNISYFIISLVILAIITSLPDTLLGINAAKKGKISSSLATAAGANIFNICIGLGITIIVGIFFMGLNPKVDFDSISFIFLFLIIYSILYLLITYIKKLKKYHFIPLLIAYIIFILYIYIK